MAPGMAIASEGGDNNIYNGKITAFVILSCMMAGMGGVIFGYDIGISGLFIPLILSLSLVLLAI